MTHLHVCNLTGPSARHWEAAIDRLLPFWEPHFQRVTRGPKNGDAWEEASHFLTIATPGSAAQNMDSIPSSEHPEQLGYLWLGLLTPFVTSDALRVASIPDFCVTMGGMPAQCLRKGVAENGAANNKQLFKLARAIRALRPGVDKEIWRPLTGYRLEFGREEIRQALLPNTDDRAFVVLHALDPGADISTAYATVGRLQELLDRPVTLVSLWADDDWPRQVAQGSEIERFIPLKDLPPDTTLNLLYNAADLFLCTSCVGEWPFLAAQAMAAGCVVAAPNEHIWLELCDEGRGLELPTGMFEESCNLLCAGDRHLVRRVMPGEAARVIADAWQTEQFKEVRERGIAWAQLDPDSTWGRCANEWLGLFGIL